MKPRTLAVALIIVALTGLAAGQMRSIVGGGGATSGMGHGQSSVGGMHGASQSGMGGPNQSGATMTPMQRRQLMNTTPMQDHKYQSCTQAMGKVEGDLSRMHAHHGGNSSSGASADDQGQSNDSSDSLSSDLEDLSQSDDDLSASLNPDQQAIVASKIKDLDKKTKEMQVLAKQLRLELGNPETDPKIVQGHMKKLNKLSKEIAKQQHEIASALGISA